MARQKQDITILSVIHACCCGLDVHKDKISACLITCDEQGQDHYEIKEFGAFTDELLQLKEWLVENDCPIVAMESTSVYWRPVHNVLEGYLEVILVNARHVKNVPGRKTDIEDSRWLAGLLRVGLVRGSYIPVKEVRHWRELARSRKTYTESLGDYKRRVHKLFETANIKIDSVVTDLFGKTGRNLIELLCQKELLEKDDIEVRVKGSLQGKVEELYRSVQGYFEQHHQFLLKSLMRTVSSLESEIAILSDRIKELMQKQEDVIRRLDEVPGINTVSSQNILGELGAELSNFPSSQALASWAGLCPGNNESAGKRRSGRSPVRSHILKTFMIEIAWAAVKTKGTYYRDKYYRLRARLGPKKAIVAIAHRILKAIYGIVKNGDSYRELGEDFHAKRDEKNKLNHLRKQAKLLGYQLVPLVAE